MSYDALLIHTVVVKNYVAGAAGRYGDAAEGYDAGVSTPGRVQQLAVGGQEREQLAGGDIRETQFKVFLPVGVPVDGLSRIEWSGRLLQAQGEPTTVYDSTGAHHVEVNAQEVRGG
jgi:hypothetical protein